MKTKLMNWAVTSRGGEPHELFTNDIDQFPSDIVNIWKSSFPVSTVINSCDDQKDGALCDTGGQRMLIVEARNL